MSRSTTATVNQHLSTYAFGIAQDVSSSLAEFIAPTVPTGGASGQFKKYDEKNAFQIFDTGRGVGGPAKRMEMLATDPFFNCSPQALEIPIDDHERALAGENSSQLEEAKIKTVVTAAALSHENKVFAKIAAAVAATGSIGVWSNPANNDPIDDIDSQIEAIAIATGMMPNRIVFGLGAWRIFRKHSKVIARQPGADLIGLNVNQAAGMLLNPGMEIRIGLLSKDTAKIGAAKSATNIVGAEVYIFFNSDSPSIYDPSFAKTFATRAGGVDQVRQYREEGNRSDIYAIDWTEDIQVVSNSLVRRITLS